MTLIRFFPTDWIAIFMKRIDVRLDQNIHMLRGARDDSRSYFYFCSKTPNDSAFHKVHVRTNQVGLFSSPRSIRVMKDPYNEKRAARFQDLAAVGFSISRSFRRMPTTAFDNLIGRVAREIDIMICELSLLCDQGL